LRLIHYLLAAALLAAVAARGEPVQPSTRGRAAAVAQAADSAPAPRDPATR
jgi:hypothetical protein